MSLKTVTFETVNIKKIFKKVTRRTVTSETVSFCFKVGRFCIVILHYRVISRVLDTNTVTSSNDFEQLS